MYIFSMDAKICNFGIKLKFLNNKILKSENKQNMQLL